MSTIDAKHFYNEVMPTKQGADYEQARWHKNAVASVGYDQTKASIEQHLPTAADISTVLEVGPGAGTWTKSLLAAYPEASFTLLDISREMLDRARAAVDEKNITFVESEFGAYTPEQQFDLFFSSRMLEYMEDKNLFVQQIAALTKPGGQVLVTTKLPHYTRQKWQGKTIQDFHTGQIAPGALSALFTEAGFKVTAVRAITISVPLFKSAWLNKVAGAVIRRLPLNPITNSCVESYLVTATKS